ncbi:hypothetical protein ACQWHJ_25705, partial [Salmonella enterica subsp. enterica serovar Infantis]
MSEQKLKPQLYLQLLKKQNEYENKTSQQN